MMAIFDQKRSSAIGVFFFFQAEDGIRDGHVTGVQTCALPILGADPETGEVAVGTEVRPGQVVRLHARDASSADRDLHQALEVRMQALGGRRPAGALVFACNGRGSGMFGSPDHDAEAIASELAGAPSAGFFAGGEIGPVGGEYFLHSFTATVAVFAR